MRDTGDGHSVGADTGGSRRGFVAVMAVAGLSLGLSVSLQLLVSAVVIAGPLKPWPAPDSLTVMGQVMVHPEYDIAAYVAGLALTGLLLLLSLAAVRIWARRVAWTTDAARTVAPGISLCFALAVGSLVWFLIHFEGVRRLAYDRWVLSPFESVILLIPPVMAVAALLVHGAFPRLWPAAVRWLLAPPAPVRYGFDAAVFLGISALVYVPKSAELAGRIYLREEFLHWDYFAMGPATQFHLGAALGTDVFSLYGIGFPCLLGVLHPIYRLSHEHTLHLLIAYGCIYTYGVYLLLRTLHATRPLAACAVLLFLLCTWFAPIWNTLQLATLWQWPSTTFLRAPTDVWFFLALAMHARTGRLGWLIAAAASALLGIFFITDTGTGLLIVFALYSLYWIAAPRPAPRTIDRTRRAAHLAASIAVGASLLAAGLLIASRGTMVTDPRRFLMGWLEAFLGYGADGVGSMYFLSRIGMAEAAVFMAMTGLFLCALALGGYRAMRRQPAALYVVVGLLGFYGLGRMTYFLHRTLPNNLHHGAMPAVVLIVVLAVFTGRLLAVALSRDDRHGLMRNIAPYAKALLPAAPLVLLTLGIWSSPSFKDYPSALRVFTKGGHPGGHYLLPEHRELGGLPDAEEGRIAAFHETVDTMKELSAGGRRVGVLDHTAALYHLTAGVPPWGRDIGAYYNILTWDQMARYQAALRADPPAQILLRRTAPNPFFEDTWLVLQAFLDEHADRSGTAGAFDVFTWRTTAGVDTDGEAP